MNFLEQPSKEQYLDILKDIGADEISIKGSLEYLIEWLEKTKYLPSVKDETFLTTALLRCKNSLEKTTQFLDCYYTRRTLGQAMFAIRDPSSEKFKVAQEFLQITPFPKLTPAGYRILHLKLGSNISTDHLEMDSITSMMQMYQEVLMKSDRSKGFIFIIDCEHFNLAMCTMFLVDFKKLYDISTKTAKVRVFETYLLNISPAFQKLYEATKYVMSGKMLGRVHTWTKKPEELIEVLPKNVLPVDIGGEERPLNQLRDAWLKDVLQCSDWFKAEENIKADLSKRPESANISNDILLHGASGAFRQMTVD